QVGDEDPPGVHGDLRVRDHPPRLGQVEHHAVHSGLGDALVDVALLDAKAPGLLRIEEQGDVGRGASGEVRAELVADDLGAGAQESHRQCSGADTRLHDLNAGEDVGCHEDRPEVLRVDDL